LTTTANQEHVMAERHQKTKQIACGQIVPDCGFVASAATEDDLLKQVITHARDSHGVTELTPELDARIRAAITEVG
jgi:predicted small metal-binding protein